jgi:hypothetical protein
LNYYIYKQLIGTCARFINFRYEGDDKEQQKTAVKELHLFVGPLLKVNETLNKYKSNMLKMKFRYMSKLLCYNDTLKFAFNGTFKYTSLTSNNLIDGDWKISELNSFWDKVLKRTDSDKIINDSESDEDEVDGKNIDYEDSKLEEINTMIRLVMPIADKYEVWMTRAMEHKVDDIDDLIRNPQLYQNEIDEIKKICNQKMNETELKVLTQFQVMFENYIANYGKV